MARRKIRRGSSIGELYKKISFTSQDFTEGERKLVREVDPPYVRLCKRLGAFFPSLGKGGTFNEETTRAIEFLGWKLTPEVFTAAIKVFLMLSILGAFVVGTIVLFTPLNEVLSILADGNLSTVLAMAYFPFLLIAVGIVYYFQSYPLIAAKREQTLALTYVPEIMGYMVMSLKLVPNLEKAVEFAAEHGQGKIADDFKEVIWNTQVGYYNSVSEGLDAMAYRWGRYSQEFKKALMRVRASVIENSDAKRQALLDQTMTEMLESIRNKMEDYARGLSQPTTILFYIGVLLPLLLIIILPVGSSFSGAPLANPLVLFLIYNIVLPLITILFAYNLLQSRPPTYKPPVIPDDYPGLPPKWKTKIGGVNVDVRFLALGILVIGVLGSLFVSNQGLPPKFLIEEGDDQIIPADRAPAEALLGSGRETNYFSVDPDAPGELYLELAGEQLRFGPLTEETTKDIISQVRSDERVFFSQSANDVTPSILIFGFLFTIAIAVYYYFRESSKYKRKVQLEIEEMETEFKDSLYIIASRLGENKPIEDAMKHVQEFLPDFKISKVIFAKTLDNIKLMGMPLYNAVFDPNLGSVSKIPSTIIRGSMKMLIDSVQLGVNVAARTMISLSIQLQNSEKVNNSLKVLVSNVTGTMNTMTIFIAPLVLGITTSLQRVVIVTISSLASSSVLESANRGGSDFGGSFGDFSSSSFISADAIAGIASPTQFIFIVAIYIIELVVIMIYFTTKIEEDNNLLVRMNIGSYLPIAIIMFVISMFVSNAFLGVL